MAITSIRFQIFILVTLFLYLIRARTGYRQTILLIASAVFVVSQSDSAAGLLPLVVFVAAGYGLVWVAGRKPSGLTMGAMIATYVLGFAYIKHYSAFAFLGTPLSGPYVTLGISYILFRVLQLAIDRRAGLVTGPIRLPIYLLYTCSLLTLVSGPIQRFEDFEQEVLRLDNFAPTDSSVYKAFSRIVNGMLKALLIAEPLSRLHESWSSGIAESSEPFNGVSIYWVAAIAYTLYMYVNFVAYMDIVIGLGWLFGFDLPENFNRPFESVSFLELWSRWHITLSRWFQSYVFNPVQLALVRRWSNPKAAPYLGAIAFFVTFLLMGIWHGSTPAFVVYGFMLGGGASVNRLYQVLMQRTLGKKRYGALKQRPIYTLLGRGLTFAYFSLALTCFWLDVHSMLNVIEANSVLHWIGSWVAVCLVSGSCVAIASGFQNGLQRVSKPLYRLYTFEIYRQAVLVVKVAILIGFSVVGVGHTVEFVYQAF